MKTIIPGLMYEVVDEVASLPNVTFPIAGLKVRRAKLTAWRAYATIDVVFYSK